MTSEEKKSGVDPEKYEFLRQQYEFLKKNFRNGEKLDLDKKSNRYQMIHNTLPLTWGIH